MLHGSPNPFLQFTRVSGHIVTPNHLTNHKDIRNLSRRPTFLHIDISWQKAIRETCARNAHHSDALDLRNGGTWPSERVDRGVNRPLS